MEWESNIDPVINKCKVEYLVSSQEYQKSYFSDLQTGLESFDNLILDPDLFFAVFVDYQGYFKTYSEKQISEGITTVVFNTSQIPDIVSYNVSNSVLHIELSYVLFKVVYEISTDINFTNVVKTSESTTSKFSESLVLGSYFFRVRSVDQFNNFSQYSKVISFSVV